MKISEQTFSKGGVNAADEKPKFITNGDDPVTWHLKGQKVINTALGGQEVVNVMSVGMTKREEFSARNMASIIASDNIASYNDEDLVDAARFAVKAADALVYALNNTEPPAERDTMS